MLIQATSVVSPTSTGTGHIVSDIFMWTIVVGLSLKQVIDILRVYGFLSEKNGRGPISAKTIGRLSLDSFQTILRHEVRDMLQPITLKMKEYHEAQMDRMEKELDKLEQINLGIREIAIILRERN